MRTVLRANVLERRRVLVVEEGKCFLRFGPSVAAQDRKAVGVALFNRKLGRVIPDLADRLLPIADGGELRVGQQVL